MEGIYILNKTLITDTPIWVCILGLYTRFLNNDTLYFIYHSYDGNVRRRIWLFESGYLFILRVTFTYYAHTMYAVY